MRFHQIRRPNVSFYTFLLFSPINLTACYHRMNKTSAFPSAIGISFAVKIIVIFTIIRMKVLSEKSMKVPWMNHLRINGKNKGRKQAGRENDSRVLLQMKISLKEIRAEGEKRIRRGMAWESS